MIPRRPFTPPSSYAVVPYSLAPLVRRKADDLLSGSRRANHELPQFRLTDAAENTIRECVSCS
jgi:hypothetical protein